jgi:hypothetical protein
LPGIEDQEPEAGSGASLILIPKSIRKGAPMAFKPNYRQQRAERDRQARAKQAEKLKKLQERSEQRKAERDRAGDPPPGEQAQEEQQEP